MMKHSSKLTPPGSARLFTDAHVAVPPAGVHIANIDGASRGNPGPASYAVVLRDASGKIVLELAKNIGRETNNVAEYYALLAALDYAATHDIHALRIRSDSELLVRQMQGRYKVKSPDLKPLHERASKLTRQFQYFVIEHVRRELNSDADALANVALDQPGVSGVHREATKPESHPSRRISQPSVAKEDAEPEQRPSQPVRSAPFSPLKIRARFVSGVLVPTESLDLPEGTEVTLNIRRLLTK
ncbi:MAG TPA: reverse transcriptase-like protein [Candidatus Acidoferrales bacterium]|nr:reverse transcriptase-like protein [Candidatus Acidoferrales bacterium]